MIRILESSKVKRLLTRRQARLEEAEKTVRPILNAVRKHGDKALLKYARRLDKLERKSVRIPPEELHVSCIKLSEAFRQSVGIAAANIRTFAGMQLPVEQWREIRPGLRLGQLVRPLDTIAAYIPGGRYPLPSTVMMTVIPAQIAGVSNILIACPRPVPEILGTAHMLGVNTVFEMGGAQAIAAFA